MNKKRFLVVVAAIIFASCGFGRLFTMPPAEELRRMSDLIVVGTVTEVRNLDETNGELRGVLTTFRINRIVKGVPDSPLRVEMHHYRFAETNLFIVNGPNLVSFAPNKTNRYELLLKKDGFWYSPVSGQVDPSFSVREVAK